MTRGVGKNVVSIVRKRCPVCGYKQSKKSKLRGKFIVYETKNKWILKCINKTCEGKIIINKNESDICIHKNNVINEHTILEKMEKLRGML